MKFIETILRKLKILFLHEHEKNEIKIDYKISTQEENIDLTVFRPGEPETLYPPNVVEYVNIIPWRIFTEFRIDSEFRIDLYQEDNRTNISDPGGMAENFDLQEYIENLGEQYFWSAEYGKMIVKSDSEGVIDPNEATSSNQTPRLTESNLVNVPISEHLNFYYNFRLCEHRLADLGNTQQINFLNEFLNENLRFLNEWIEIWCDPLLAENVDPALEAPDAHGYRYIRFIVPVSPPPSPLIESPYVNVHFNPNFLQMHAQRQNPLPNPLPSIVPPQELLPMLPFQNILPQQNIIQAGVTVNHFMQQGVNFTNLTNFFNINPANTFFVNANILNQTGAFFARPMPPLL